MNRQIRLRVLRRHSGSMLPLIITVVIVICLIGIFVLNYAQFFSSHKQAQTAIDAAALQAAIDLQKVVVTANDGTYFGTVGVVDDMPPANDLNKRPVIGINTLMATIRLDSLIADKLGNNSMIVMAAQDLRCAEHDAQLLKNKMADLASGGVAKDKNGQVINLANDVAASYDANSVRSMKGAKRKGDLTISFGTVIGAEALTLTPVPSPLSMAQVTASNSIAVNGVNVYLANTNVDTAVLGKNLRFRFVPLADKVALITPSAFSLLPGGANTIATAVKVEGDEEIGLAATNEQGGSTAKTIHVMAYAQSGGNPGGSQFPSGTLQVSFPFAGPPPAGQGVDFTSVSSIMNNSMVSVVDSNLTTPNPDLNGNFGTASPYTGWNASSKGNWFKAQGGSVPADANASLVQDKFRGRDHDDPSVVLSFVVYDWLRSLYLRPNIANVVTALSAPFWPGAQSASYLEDGVLQPVYAEVEATHPITFGLFNVSKTGEGDPRDLSNFADNPDGYRRQFANVFGYVAADATLPDTSLVVAMDNHGNTISTNGRPAQELMDFYQAITRTNKLAGESLKNAKEVILEKLAEGAEAQQYLDKNPNGPLAKENKTKREKATMILARALAVAKNAVYAMDFTLAVYNDRKTLSGLGIIEHSDGKFELATGYIYPLFQSATKTQILGLEKIPTGQDKSLSSRDWTSSNVGEEDKFVLESATKKMMTGRSIDPGDRLLPPALASSSVPLSNNNIFAFNVDGSGNIVRSTPHLSLAGPNLLAGQQMYQNTAAFVSGSDDSLINQVWNCMARDNGASASGGYFADSQSPGNNSNPNGANYPPLVGEWSLRCPAPTVQDFCRDSQGQVATTVVTGGFDQQGVRSNFLDVTVSVDSAGNTKYFFQGKEVHFFQDYDTWARMQTSTLGYVLPGGLVGANYGNFKASWVDYLSYLNYSSFYSYFLGHGNPSVTASGLGAGTYSLSQLGGAGYQTMMNHIWTIYNTSTFYTDNGGCSKLFVWSS